MTPVAKPSGGNMVLKTYAGYLAERGNAVSIMVFGPATGFFDEVERRGVTLMYRSNALPARVNLLFFHLLHLPGCRVPCGDFDIIVPVFFPLVPHAIALKAATPGAIVVPLFQDPWRMRYFGVYNRRVLLPSGRVRGAVAGMVAVSQASADLLRPHCAKVAVVRNGIDLAAFAGCPAGAGPGFSGYLLFVGGKAKGLGFLRKALPALAPLGLPLLVVTGSPRGLARAKAAGMDMEILPPQTPLAMPGLYRNARVYLSLSSSESFGLTPLEAMACGTPVVAMRTEGIGEYAVDGENILLLDSFSPKDLAENVRRILDDNSLGRRLAENGAATAARYDVAEACAGYEAAMQDFLVPRNQDVLKCR
jgi:glycosyltransferase involved in cell wall biosynthesis